jgi:tetratricopeptide (TPR) repeat protein
MRYPAIAILCCFTLAAVPSRLRAQDNERDNEEAHHHHAADSSELGTVNFPSSCQPASQKTFDRGLALMHSFQYTESEKAFQEAAASDARCAMARWGEAMALYNQLWDKPDAKTVKEGRKDLKQARKIKPRTARETDFIDAALKFFDTNRKLDHDARTRRYSDAMAGLYAKYPDDPEAATLYALSLLTWDPPNDKDETNRRKAIAVLNKVVAAGPNHPGAVHYLIHAADRPDLAPLALDAARRYAKIAPGSSHAIHMPSHIFSRLGLWQESIDSNLPAAKAAEREINAHLAEPHYEFHPMDFLQYAYLQSGREKDAWHIVEEVDTVPGTTESQRDGHKAYFSARYYLETHDWARAASMTVAPSLSAEQRLDVFWAQAIGSARSGDATAARKALDNYKKDDDGASTYRPAVHAMPGMAPEFSVERSESEAWTLYAEGKKDDALKMLRAAAEKEDADPPEVGLPAREMLADMLLDMNRNADALAEYQATLKGTPNRFDSLYGAAHAAELSGKPQEAADYYAQLLKVCNGGVDSTRPEIARAKTLLATK